jgi:hypothetical protein
VCGAAEVQPHLKFDSVKEMLAALDEHKPGVASGD